LTIFKEQRQSLDMHVLYTMYYTLDTVTSQRLFT
jgi:hypothetical protein